MLPEALTESGYRGRSLVESGVVHAVWDEVGGELVEEFVVPTTAPLSRRSTSRSGWSPRPRAYFDALRDLVAPSFGWTVLRVPAPECNAPIAANRLMERIRDMALG